MKRKSHHFFVWPNRDGILFTPADKNGRRLIPGMDDWWRVYVGGPTEVTSTILIAVARILRSDLDVSVRGTLIFYDGRIWAEKDLSKVLYRVLLPEKDPASL